jgi:3-phenylpropionate/cinnamic acid dioxygenase small subunit
MSDASTLQDKQEITELCYRYGMAVDNRDWALLATCFTPDAEAFYEGLPPCPNYQAIEDTCSAALTPLTGSQHLIGNVLVDVDGDTASSTCYLQAQHVKAGTDGGDLFIFAGRYRDKLVRTEAGWRITERRLDAMWTDGNPAVLGG